MESESTEKIENGSIVNESAPLEESALPEEPTTSSAEEPSKKEPKESSEKSSNEPFLLKLTNHLQKCNKCVYHITCDLNHMKRQVRDIGDLVRCCRNKARATISLFRSEPLPTLPMGLTNRIPECCNTGTCPPDLADFAVNDEKYSNRKGLQRKGTDARGFKSKKEGSGASLASAGTEIAGRTIRKPCPKFKRKGDRPCIPKADLYIPGRPPEQFGGQDGEKRRCRKLHPKPCRKKKRGTGSGADGLDGDSQRGSRGGGKDSGGGGSGKDGDDDYGDDGDDDDGHKDKRKGDDSRGGSRGGLDDGDDGRGGSSIRGKSDGRFDDDGLDGGTGGRSSGRVGSGKGTDDDGDGSGDDEGRGTKRPCKRKKGLAKKPCKPQGKLELPVDHHPLFPVLPMPSESKLKRPVQRYPRAEDPNDPVRGRGPCRGSARAKETETETVTGTILLRFY
ncbi:UNVERIFIED_CONTAM: hypothetical protein PYX00_007336 [Menopon gallinae]|uniref:Uncharacterized protein n=1 Tax=Menopon gallinae TaxID=328185 RepID=A0AAW2HJK5_9NEOP